MAPKKKDEELCCRHVGCRKSFLTRSGRLKHEKKCSHPPKVIYKPYNVLESGRFSCKLCNKDFAHATGFYKHHNKCTSAGKQKKVFKCEVCSKEFPKRSRLVQHEVKHSEKPKISCGCGRFYQRQDKFLLHQSKCQQTTANIESFDQTANLRSEEDLSFPSMAAQPSFSFLDDDESVASFSGVSTPNLSILDYNDSLPSRSGMSTPDNMSLTGLSCSVISNNSGICTPQIDVEEDAQSNRSHDWKYYKSKERQSEKLSHFFHDLSEKFDITEMANIVRKAAESNEASIVESLLITGETLNHVTTSNGILSYLKERASPDQTSELLYYMFGDKLCDESFFSWVCKQIDKRYSRTRENLCAWLFRDFGQVPKNKGGRPTIDDATKQAIFDKWIEKSTTTVDRRNGRDQAKMLKTEFEERYKGIDTREKRTEKMMRNREIVMFTKRPCICTIKEVYQSLLKDGLNISYGTSLQYKPFFVVSPTEREKESCLCKFCLNTRLLYRPILKHLKKNVPKTLSMTAYFGDSIDCMPGENGFFKESCITSNCEFDSCKQEPKYKLSDFDCSPDAKTKYHQFVTDIVPYKNKKGEDKKSTRTVRKDFEADFSNLKETFDNLAIKYLLHRFECKNDSFYWPQILAARDLGYIFHMDYSENISATPKEEPQDAHFSGKQTSLHCTVAYLPDGNHQYQYHMSDDLGHDTTFTVHVVRDLLAQYSDYKNYDLVRFKSDNCSVQYCCKNVFFQYSQLSQEINKPIIIYYGIAGHGRGLVDAMSGFGLKTPLRRAIVCENFWFNTSKELYDFITEKYSTDTSKIYVNIPAADLTTKRGKKSEEEEIVIKGCRKSRMISFHPDGSYQIARHMCNCCRCIVGHFIECINLIGNNRDENDNDDEYCVNEDQLDDEGTTSLMFEMVFEGSYVAIHSFERSLELFYICYITGKHIATENVVDLNNHAIQKGYPYFEAVYLEKVDTKRRKVLYKKLVATVFLRPDEIFCPAVSIEESDMSLSISEYQFIADCAN